MSGVRADRGTLAGPSREGPSRYGLTPLQIGLAFESLKAEGSGHYVEQVLVTLGDADVTALRPAWRLVMDRHEVLRSRLDLRGEGQAQQEVLPEVEVPLELRDLDGVRGRGPEDRMERYLAEDAALGFDLSRAPLFRLTLFRVSAGETLLVWTYHHAILDSTGRFLVLGEVFAGYDALRREEEPAFEPSESFRSYVEFLEGRDDESDRAFWSEQLSGYTGVDLPPVAVENSKDAGATGRLGIWLGDDLRHTVAAFAERHGISVGTLLHAAWALLIGRYTASEDVVFGATRAGRRTVPGGESMVGLLMNTLPLRVRMPPDARVGPWLVDLDQWRRAVPPHEHTPMRSIQSAGGLAAGTPLFETVFDFTPYLREEQLSSSGVPSQQRDVVVRGRTHYPLTAMFEAGANAYRLTLLYQPARFGSEAIARLAEQYQVVLRALVSGRECRLSDLPLLGERQEEVLLKDWGSAPHSPESAKTLANLFEEQADREPEATAVVYGQTALTYRQLDVRSSRLAHRLRTLGVDTGAVVGVCLERSREMVISILGVVRAGAAYLPLDPDHPLERLIYMVEDSSCPVVLARRGSRAASALADRTRVLLVDDDDERTLLRSLPAEAPESAAGPEDIAYVNYTSGSTGRPKGVAVPNRAIPRLVRDPNYISLAPDDVVAQAANASFDALTFELWGALLNGARLVMIRREDVLSPRRLARRLQNDGVTVLFLTTALFNAVVREQPAAFRGLRTLLFGGEAADPVWVRKVLQVAPPGRLLHVYGPTEATTFASFHEVEAVAADARTVPIGRPLTGTRLLVVDAHDRLVPAGVPGELLIGGEGLALGYIGDSELTERKFRPAAFSTGSVGRLYRTGDLVRWTSRGALDFVGRIDEQVKIRGFRIEPGEIRTALERHPSIREAFVMVRREPPGERYLAAYIVPSAEPAPTIGDVRRFIARHLPDHMIPQGFAMLEELPLNANGKVDQGGLPAPGRTVDREGAAPATDLERKIAAVWCEILGVERVGVEQGFFESGGDSLLAMSLIARLEELAGRELPVSTVLESPTVRGMAEMLASDERSVEPGRSRLLVALRREGTSAPLFCLHPGTGNAFVFAELAQHLDGDQPVYALRAQGLEKGERALRRVEDMAERYLEEVRVLQPKGPYRLAAVCFGAKVAFEMARQLRASSEEVELLAVIDAPGPRLAPSRVGAPARADVGSTNGTGSEERESPMKRLIEPVVELPRRLNRGISRLAGRSTYHRLAHQIAAGRLHGVHFRRIRRINRLCRTAGRSYVGRPYPGSLLLLLSNSTVDPTASSWLRLASDVDVVRVPGRHHTVMREPHVRAVADAIQERLDAISDR